MPGEDNFTIKHNSFFPIYFSIHSSVAKALIYAK